MRTLVIGRSPFADVVLAEPSVAPHHAELVVAGDGRLHVTDCAKGAGTYRLVNERWTPIRQAFVTAEEPLKLGDHVCSAAELLRVAREPEAGAASRDGVEPHGDRRHRLRGRVERDAQTGEIVRRRP